MYFNLVSVSPQQAEVSRTWRPQTLSHHKMPQMSEHHLCYHEKNRQITSHFGSTYLFKSKLTFTWSHKLWHHFQWSISRLVAMLLSLWKGKRLSLKEGCSNVLLPSSHNPITQQPPLFCPQQEFHRVENTSISHITRWKMETQTTRRCTACFLKAIVKVLGLFL